MLVLVLIRAPPTQNYDKGRWGPLTLCVTHPIRSPVLFITIPPSPLFFKYPILLFKFTKTPPVKGTQKGRVKKMAIFVHDGLVMYIFFLLHSARWWLCNQARGVHGRVVGLLFDSVTRRCWDATNN